MLSSQQQKLQGKASSSSGAGAGRNHLFNGGSNGFQNNDTDNSDGDDTNATNTMINAGGAVAREEVVFLSRLLFQILTEDADNLGDGLSESLLYKRLPDVMGVEGTMALGGSVDAKLMTESLNYLSENNSIEFLSLRGELVFKARNESERQILSSLSPHDRIIYNFIRESGAKGTWVKHIKEKSGLHSKIVVDCVGRLEKRALIKSVKSVKTPTKKVYMLAGLEPSVELTGGAWYTDQQMDTEFIDTLSAQIFKYISSKGKPSGGLEHINPAARVLKTGVRDIHAWLSNSGVTHHPLSSEDVQALIDRLSYDGKIVPITTNFGAVVYTINNSGTGDLGKGVCGGVGGSPCGSCPVFDFCEEGGPISPSNCEYFAKYLLH